MKEKKNNVWPETAVAFEQPKERPISHWTGQEIADEVMRRGIVP